MTKTIRDIPSIEGETVADRLKSARENSGMTRKALADATGIPASSLEKYERGDMDPNTTRLQSICEHLNVTVDWVLKGDYALTASGEKSRTGNQVSVNVAEPLKPAESQASANFAENALVTAQLSLPANENTPLEHARSMLSDLDNMRHDDFNGTQRGAMALIDQIQAMLKRLEPGELLALAEEQDLYQDDGYLDTSSILELFANDHSDGETYCETISDRMLDTCILGVDLFSIERDPLVDIANVMEEEHGIESTKFFGWGKHYDFVPLIRPHLWAMAIYSDGYDFGDQEDFPRQEQVQDDENGSSFDIFSL